ncbi:MAG: Fe-S cluster assembly ATPase SufC [Mycoplasmataceae bacterium]|jgi:Fe-S cluster assembly ATP-binding protein|nr:Fe-S cluster assembly ATPase SufC [Mycoplasmataceae bacterium]
MNILKIHNLTTLFDKKRILNDISLTARQPEVIAILGPNGAGKSTLLKAIMHHFSMKTQGSIKFNNHELTKMSTDKIAKLGVFYATQNPIELEGVQTLDFLKIIANENSPKQKVGFYQLYSKINELIKLLDLPSEILTRNVNVGFSGGQKKKNEILQSQLFNPSLILLDEIDSGLDFDATKLIANFINKKRHERITFIVSHQLEFLHQVNISKVIILIDGKIVKIGGTALIREIEKNGYKQYAANIKSEADFEITDPYLTCHKK